MKRLVVEAAEEADTTVLGAALGTLLPAGTTVALCGTLGSGKTRLAQSVAEALGVPRGSVVSPTFVLVQEHQGRRPLYHFDAYRLADADEFLQLGPEEYFDGVGLTLVEWADRVADCLPEERVEVHIEVIGETARRFEILAVGSRFEPVLARIAARMARGERREADGER